jgi:hypothetical protein
MFAKSSKREGRQMSPMDNPAHSAAGSDTLRSGTSALRGPILGLLLRQERPLSAYRLSGLLAQRLPAWCSTPQGVSNLLNRLVSEGLVSRVPGTAVTFTATDTAPLALEEWMRRPCSTQHIRDELHARIASSSVHHAPLLLQALDEYERECFRMLADEPSEGATHGSWTALTLNLTNAAVDESVRANIKWCKLARQWIKEWIKDASAQSER